MTVHKAYLAEPHILTGEAIVTELISGERPVVRLDKTYFHPQGGGQKGDKGLIGTVVVLDTKHVEGGEVDHFVTSFDDLAVRQTYPIKIDAASRRINAAHHSGGHLIAALVDPAFPQIKAVQGHHWPGESRVEFDGEITDDLITKMQAFIQPALDKAIAEQWPIAVLGDPFVNRSVQFGSSCVPCGGTHVAHLGQIGSIIVKNVKKKGERLRIHYDATINEAAF